MHKVQTFQKNHVGRDFVVGDLHGCFDLLNKALENIGFDKSKDRLFAVGDLVDRGPDSWKCLQLITEPWFHSVMGNHEAMTVQGILGGDTFLWYQNGGTWANDLNHDERVQLNYMCLDYIQDLPSLITVKDGDKALFHVLHADLDSNYGLVDKDLEEENFREFADEACIDGEVVFWGRGIFYHLCGVELDERKVSKWLRDAAMHKIGTWAQNPSLARVFVGHTPVLVPTRTWAVTNIDTYAYGTCKVNGDGGLTITEPATDKFWYTNQFGTKEVKVKVVV